MAHQTRAGAMMDTLDSLRRERDQLANERARLDYTINFLRLPLQIDPKISNLDTVQLLAAFHVSLSRLGVLP